MKLIIKELKENEPLKIKKVIHHEEDSYPVDLFEEQTKEIIEEDMIQMKVFTDGEIIKEEEPIFETIDEYYIGNKKYKHDVDTLKTKNVYLNNYSYVIAYTIAKELQTNGNIKGWFNVIKDISIYLKDLKDKGALKKAKKAVKDINDYNNRVNYSSILNMISSQEKSLRNYETITLTENIYLLKKRII